MRGESRRNPAATHPAAEPAIETGRLVSSLDVEVARRADGRFAVYGGSGRVYTVNLDEPVRPMCNCPDSIYRHNTRCKHVLAVMRETGDADLVAPLRAIMGGGR